MDKTPSRQCSWDICNKRLKDFCFRSEVNGKLYCDDICCERDLEALAEKKARFLWN